MSPQTTISDRRPPERLSKSEHFRGRQNRHGSALTGPWETRFQDKQAPRQPSTLHVTVDAENWQGSRCVGTTHSALPGAREDR